MAKRYREFVDTITRLYDIKYYIGVYGRKATATYMAGIIEGFANGLPPSQKPTHGEFVKDFNNIQDYVNTLKI